MCFDILKHGWKFCHVWIEAFVWIRKENSGDVNENENACNTALKLSSSVPYPKNNGGQLENK
jgi:hypothetical protein